MDLFTFTRKYAKFIMAVLSAVGVTTLVALLSGGLSLEAIITAAVTALGAASVFAFPNGELGWQRYTKFIVALITAVGVSTVSALITGSLTVEQIGAGVFALFGSLSVYGVTNEETDPDALDENGSGATDGTEHSDETADPYAQVQAAINTKEAE